SDPSSTVGHLPDGKVSCPNHAADSYPKLVLYNIPLHVVRDLGLGIERPLEKVSRARASQKFISFHNHAAARQHRVGHARNLNSLEHRIIDAHVVRLCADGVLAFGVEDHQIRIATHGDRALARIQAKEFCGCCGNQFHKTVHAESPTGNAAGIDEAHAVLDSGAAVWNLGEVVAAQFFLLFETEGAV